METARFLDCMCLALRGFWTMAPLRYAAKFDLFLFLPSGNIEGVLGLRQSVGIHRPHRLLHPPSLLPKKSVQAAADKPYLMDCTSVQGRETENQACKLKF